MVTHHSILDSVLNRMYGFLTRSWLGYTNLLNQIYYLKLACHAEGGGGGAQVELSSYIMVHMHVQWFSKLLIIPCTDC